MEDRGKRGNGAESKYAGMAPENLNEDMVILE